MPPNPAGGAHSAGTLSWREEPRAGAVPGTPRSIPHPDGLGLCPGIPSSSGARHWERGESTRLMILPPRPLDTAHLAQAVGRCDENQAAQLGEHNMLEEEVP